MASLKIGHPTNDRPVTSLAFVASGMGPRGKVRGELIFLGDDWKPKQRQTIKKIPGSILHGATLQQPPGWAIAFKVKSPGFYVLLVHVVGPGVVETSSVVFQIKVKAKGKAKGPYGLGLSFPIDDDHVSASFSAYGSFGNETSVSGTMTCASSHPFQSGPLPVMPPMSIWYLPFQIPTMGGNAESNADNPFTFKVFETGNPGNSKESTPVTVDGLT